MTDTTTPTTTPSPAAARMRLSRERRRRGSRIFTVELFGFEIEKLVHRGLLPADKTGDAEAVTAALYRLFDASL